MSFWFWLVIVILVAVAVFARLLIETINRAR